LNGPSSLPISWTASADPASTDAGVVAIFPRTTAIYNPKVTNSPVRPLCDLAARIFRNRRCFGLFPLPLAKKNEFRLGQSDICAIVKPAICESRFAATHLAQGLTVGRTRGDFQNELPSLMASARLNQGQQATSCPAGRVQPEALSPAFVARISSQPSGNPTGHTVPTNCDDPSGLPGIPVQGQFRGWWLVDS